MILKTQRHYKSSSTVAKSILPHQMVAIEHSILAI